MDNFNFNDYDTEKLKEVKNEELLKENIQVSNPGLKNEEPKETDFFDFNEAEIFGQSQAQAQQEPDIGDYPQNPEQQQGLSLPYDNNSYGNSYLALVLSPNLRELELMIRGLEYVQQYNNKTQKDEFILRKIRNHPLNEYGINQIITQLKIYTSPEIKLGRKRAQDYYNSVQHVGKTIVRLIYKNLKSFGMDTQEKQRNAKVFCDAIIEVIDASYSRSIEGKENDLSRATEFKIEGNIDSLNDPSKYFGMNKNKMKN